MPAISTHDPRARQGRGWLAALAVLVIVVSAAFTHPSPAEAVNFSAAQNADRLLGAPSWTAPTYHADSNMLGGMYSPNGVAVDGSGSVYVADTSSSRLMRWGTTPASDNADMSNVLMKAGGLQTSWMSICNGGSNRPEQISVTGDGASIRMAATDRYNNRVALFTNEPTTDGATATLFLGQGSASGCSTNRGLVPAADTLASPSSAWTDGTRIAVADTGNNRVLIWNSWPASSGAPADVVLGQADMSAALANRGATPAANTLNAPKGVWFDGSFLYVADAQNHRVLAWSGWPATAGAAADYVIGAPDFVTAAWGCGNAGISYPVAVTSTGSGTGHRLAIVSESNNRVVILNGWANAPSSTPTYTSVIGQASPTSGCKENRGFAAPDATTLRLPAGAAFQGPTTLWVADAGNHRVLRFSSLANATPADRVLGQADFASNTPVRGTGQNVFNQNWSKSGTLSEGTRLALAPDGTLVAAEPGESAVRIWTGGPATDNAAFDWRIGQASRNLAGTNGPGDNPSATTFGDPRGVWTDGTRLAVTDNDNDRVLVWLTMPTSDTDPPDHVVGQASWTATASGTGANRLNSPVAVTSDGIDLFVAETGNQRVLIFRNFFLAPTNQPNADVVLGQTNFTSTSGGRSATKFSDPFGISVDPRRRLAIADQDNNRILVWNDHSTLTNGAAADVVIGQTSFTAGALGTATDDVHDVTFAGGGLAWINGCRVQVLDPLPTTGASLTAPSELGTGCSGTTLGQGRVDEMGSIAAAAGRLWVSNTGQARLMRWSDTTAPTISVAPTATVRCDGTVTVSWSTAESTTTEIRWDGVSRASWAGGYANQSIDPELTGLGHSVALSFASPGTYYARVRAQDWSGLAIESGEISFTVPATCPAPSAMFGDDANAQTGTGRANPSATSAPAIGSTAFHTSWVQSSGVTMDAVEAETWSTPPDHAGGLWHMDGSGVADPLAGASTSAVTWTGSPGYVAGRFGQAIQLDGSTQNGSAPHHASLSKSNDFTVDAWFTSSDLTVNQYPVLVQKTTGNGCNTSCTYSLQVDQAQKAFCAIFTVGTVQKVLCGPANATVSRSDGTWHNFALTVDSGNAARIYVDGLLHAGPLALGAPVDTNTASVMIGAAGAPGATNRFSGALDEVRFAPVAYDQAALLGYVRTRRPHVDRVWDGPVTALASACATTTRCGDQVYAGSPEILRQGARYWQRTRFNTLNNDYWSTWGVDWLETTNSASMNVVVGGSVAFGELLSGRDAFASSTVEVTSHAAGGYQLLARDESDTWAVERVGGGPTIADRQDGAIAPASWPADSASAFGVTVRSATGNRLAKWGPAIGGFAQDDVTNNLYAGLEGTSDVVLHERTTYSSGTDTVVVTWRVNPPVGLLGGAYDGQATISAVPNP